MAWHRVLAAVCSTVSLSCGRVTSTETLSPAHAVALADTISGVMKEYAASFAGATCANYQPILKFFDYTGAGVIDVTETAATQYSGETWPKLIRDAACSRTREDAIIDSLIVRVHTEDLVSVAWTFRATYYDTSGVTRDAKGAVLQVWHRTADGWKTPVGMSTHRPVER